MGLCLRMLALLVTPGQETRWTLLVPSSDIYKKTTTTRKTCEKLSRGPRGRPRTTHRGMFLPQCFRGGENRSKEATFFKPTQQHFRVSWAEVPALRTEKVPEKGSLEEISLPKPCCSLPEGGGGELTLAHRGHRLGGGGQP